MLRALYIDLDGTLFGKGGSLLTDSEGNFSLLAARALEACARADVEVVPFSGRRRRSTWEAARFLGCRSYIFEVGCGMHLDGEDIWLTGDLQPEDGRTVFAQIEETGAPRLLLERFPGRLEQHVPWHLEREASHIFRGAVDAFEADAVLEANGLGHLRLVDNGAIHAASPTLPGIEHPRAYHLLPRIVSKGRAVAHHQRARGYAPEECLAVGDSREDLTAAEVVGEFWLVANALDRDPDIREAIARLPNVRVAEGGHGAGVYEAVVSSLVERRGATA